MKQRILYICIALDQLLFAILTLGKQYPVCTIAAWSFVNAKNGNTVAIILKTVLDLLYRPLRADHCLDSFLDDMRHR